MNSFHKKCSSNEKHFIIQISQARTFEMTINERIKAQIINLFLFGIVDAINSPIGVEIIVREKSFDNDSDFN